MIANLCHAIDSCHLGHGPSTELRRMWLRSSPSRPADMERNSTSSAIS